MDNSSEEYVPEELEESLENSRSSLSSDDTSNGEESVEENQGDWTVVEKKKKIPKQRGQVRMYVEQFVDGVPSYDNQDWKEITLRKHNRSRQAKSKTRKTGVGKDVVRHQIKLDNETEDFNHKKVKPELIQKMLKYRRLHGLTQAELAHKINEKTEVISRYERGSIVPDSKVISKLYKLFSSQK